MTMEEDTTSKIESNLFKTDEHYFRYSILYLNFLTVPAAFIMSKILKKTYPYSNINSKRFVNKILEYYYIKFENKINFSIGLSVFVVRKREQ